MEGRYVRHMNLDESIKEYMATYLTDEFKGNTYYKFEESYILNTIAQDFKLSFEQSTKIINALRIKSTSNANCKINHKIDSRLYDFINNNRIIESPKGE